MDWRERDYYLVALDYSSFNMRMEYLKCASETMKVHAPYNHIKASHPCKSNYDGDHHKITGIGYVQFMLSCKKEDSNEVEYELRKARIRDEYGSNFVKLTKEMCGQ